MKILELRLTAFGRFTDTALDLSGGGDVGGLHIVYGPNEAGKSTSLRALRSFFYGIESRSDDNFKHAYGDMRIGATLRHSDGQEINGTRRKGVKKTLLDAQDVDVEALVLSKFLAGVAEELYRQQFGIDYDGLVRGGEDLLKGGGAVGESLFAAGMGGAGIQDILASLDDEMEALYVPRGKTRSLNVAIREYRAEKDNIRDSELRSSVWQNARKALDDTTAAVAEVGAELAGLEKERARLDRVRLALPLVAVRRNVLADLDELQDAPLLPDGFADERVSLTRDRESNKAAISEAEEDIRRLDAEIVALSVPAQIVEQGEVISGLHKRLGGHQKAAQDVIGLRALHTEATSAGTAVMKELRPELAWEDPDSLRLPQAQRVRIQNLGNQRQSLHDQQATAAERVADLKGRHDRATRELAGHEAPADARDLAIVIAEVSRSGDIEGDLARARNEVNLQQDDLDVRIRQLPLWDGSATDLEDLSPPPESVVVRMEDEKGSITAEVERLTALEEGLKEQIAASRLKLDELQMAIDVPTEDALAEARDTRDAGWALIRGAWVDGEENHAATQAFGGGAELPDAYESSVRDADDTADRLRREADRVALRATHEAAIQQAVAKLSECEGKRARAAADAVKWTTEWEALWTPLLTAPTVTPYAPREMLGWLLSLGDLGRDAAELRGKRKEASDLQVDVAKQRMRIGECLAGLGEPRGSEDESLHSLLDRAVKLRDGLHAKVDARARLQEEATRLVDEQEPAARALSAAEEAVTGWTKDWSASIAALGLGADATPSEANVVLAKLEDLAKHADEAATLEQRITGIDRDAGEFRRDVGTLVERVAPELADEPPDRCVARLHVLLRKAEKDAASLLQLETRAKNAAGKREVAEREVGRASARLGAMCEDAGCEHEDGLKDAEERSAARRNREARLSEVKEQLLDHAGTGTLDDLLSEAASVDADALPSQLRDIGLRADELRSREAELNQQIGEERRAFNEMDGSSKAAEAAERAAQLLARIGDGAERYARLKIASMVLRREIERYREENQAPILRRAGELFARLTRGSFASLATDYSQGDDPVLVGVRETDARVNVEGMSDGSRDQLYLALRLAGLERHIEANEPLPFIVDDILVKFDDDRSRAAIEALHEVAERTQVIFFTHHEHLTRLAEEAVGGAGLHVHRLEA